MSNIVPPSPEDGTKKRQNWVHDLHYKDVEDLPPLFWRHLNQGPPDACWQWQGRTSAGYGRFRQGLAHRLAWVALTGQSLTGNLTIDHLCRNRGCVNPAHLEPVTNVENTRRGHARAGRHKTAEEKLAARREWSRRTGRHTRRLPCKVCGKEVPTGSMTYHRRRVHAAETFG